MRSGLPPAVLQNIWDLADTRKSGTLNQTEFIIAMHYIESVMKGAGNLPPTLPANIYASATGRAVAPSPLVRNNTLQVNSPPILPNRSPLLQKRGGVSLDIPSDDYQKFATYFRQLDTDNSGFVTGGDAVVFFKHSGLPEGDLARIWDLADTNSSGQLNEKEFAMAMHLINRKNAGGDIPIAISTVNISKHLNCGENFY
jgi:Ca2+-binding EF-hand superfamily protein